MRPLVSVVMPVHSESIAILDEAVQSILRQTYRSWELLVVLDNPSRDDVRRHLRTVMNKDSRVRTLFPKRNLGRARARNLAVETAKGEYIAILDADDVALPHRLRRQVDYMQSHPTVDLLFGGAEVIDTADKKRRVIRISAEKIRDLRRTLFTENVLLHPTMLARRSVLLAYPYDGAFVRSQDYEFWLRCFTAQKKFAALPEPLIKYRVPASEDFDARIERQQVYEQFAVRAFAKHWSSFWQNPYYLAAFSRHLFLRAVTVLTPKPLLRLSLRWKNPR